MNKSRLESFSDCIISIVITIMVLNLQVPHGESWVEIQPVVAPLVTYIVSFIFLGIYWNNHHHMLHTITRVNGKILWANLHLLFWLSLVPFTTAWVGQNHFTPLSVALYGIVLTLAAAGYSILEKAIIADQGQDSKLARTVGKGVKEKMSLVFYASAIPLAFISPMISFALYVLVAIMWIIPDRRIEKALRE